MAAVPWPCGQRVRLACFGLGRKLGGIFVLLGLSFAWCPSLQGTHHATVHTPLRCRWWQPWFGILQGSFYYYKLQEDIARVPSQPPPGLWRRVMVESVYEHQFLSSCAALFCEPNVRFGHEILQLWKLQISSLIAKLSCNSAWFRGVWPKGLSVHSLPC